MTEMTWNWTWRD